MARLIPENAERRLRRHITSIYDTTTGDDMNKIELSLWIEENYQATATSIATRKTLFGVGVNDAHYATQPMANGVQLRDPAYRAWVNMLKRAYSPKCHARYPTYVGVTVCEEWHSFSAFRAWWLDNYREGWHLDKDLMVVGNREYSHGACIYIPLWLNSFLNGHGASRGYLPIVVCLCKKTGKYQSHCRNPITGKQHALGLFTTPEAAYSAWLRCKLDLADQLKPAMDAVDQRIYHNVVTIVKAIS